MSVESMVAWPFPAEIAESDLCVELDAHSRVRLLVGPEHHPLGRLIDGGIGELAARVHPDDLPAVIDVVAAGQARPGSTVPLVTARVRLDDSWHRYGLASCWWEDGTVTLRIVDLQSADDDIGVVSVLDRLPVAVIIGAGDRRGLWANKQARRDFALGTGEVGSAWIDQFDDASRRLVLEAIEAVRPGVDPTASFEVRAIDERIFEADVGPAGAASWTITLVDVTDQIAKRRESDFERALQNQLSAMVAEVVVVCDADFVVRRLIGGFSRYPELDLAGSIGRNWRDILDDPPGGIIIDRPGVREGAAVRALRTGDDQQGNRIVLTFPGGRVCVVSIRASVLDINGGRFVLIGLADQTDQAVAELRSVAYAELSTESAVTLNEAGEIEHATTSFDQRLGRLAGTSVGERFSRSVHPSDLGAFTRFCRTAPAFPEMAEAVIQVLDSSGDRRHFAMRAARQPLTGSLQISILDVTDELRDRDRLTKLAQHDSLTGLANRRQLRLWGAAMVAEQPCAVAAIDLDYFKPINDTHGHAVGDAVLVAFAGRLLGASRDADLVIRTGGDEFLVVMPGVDQIEAAMTLAQRFHASAVGSYRIDHEHLDVSCSIGVCVAPAGTDLDAALAAADALLYEAKESGRSTFKVRAFEG